MLIVAERINSSRKAIQEAVLSGDADTIQNEAKIQAEAGADYIDVNAGTFIREELERLQWIVEVVQDAVSLPLCIDSPDPKVIDGILPLLKKTPMINSITLEPSRLEPILPLAVAYKANVIALCQSPKGMADTADQKVAMAHELVEKAEKAGLPQDLLLVDPLVYPVSTSPLSAVAALDAIERIKEEIPGVHTICGLTNVSYGVPERKLINRTFLVAAIVRGLDSAILDPTDKKLFGSMKAALAVMGKDEYCLEFIEAYRAERIA
jgi:cobalamin-dependent methionine synthase I